MGWWRRNEERDALMTFYRPWYRRPLVWLFLLIPVLGLARLALTPLAWYQTNRALATLPEYEIRFSSMSLALLGGKTVFRNVTVHHRGEAHLGEAAALAKIRFVQVQAPLRRFIEGGALPQVDLIEPVFHLRTEPRLALSPEGRKQWSKALGRQPFSHIERLRIERGTVLTQRFPTTAGSQNAGEAVTLIRDLDATVLGIELQPASPSTSSIKVALNGGVFLGSGILTGEAALKPDGERSWDYEGNLQLAGLDIHDVHNFGAGLAQGAVGKAESPRGKIRVKAHFEAKRGLLTGIVQPEAFKEPGPSMTVSDLEALSRQAIATTSISLWHESERVSGALPATLAPIRLAASVPALLLEGARQALQPPAAPPCVPADLLAQGETGQAQGVNAGEPALPVCPPESAATDTATHGLTEATPPPPEQQPEQGAAKPSAE